MKRIGLRTRLTFEKWYLNHLRFAYTRGHNPTISEIIMRQFERVKLLEQQINEVNNCTQ